MSRSALRAPNERLDLLEIEPYQTVAVAKRVIDERERERLAQSDEPERQLRELHRRRVLVHAVEALLRDEPAGVQVRVAVLFDHAREHALPRPRRHDLARELAARGHEKRSGAHRRIADLELEDLLRRALRPEACEQRFEGALHHFLGQ